MHSVGIVISHHVNRALEPFADYLEVDRYKVFLSSEEIESMAEHYKLEPTDLGALCQKMGDWQSSEGFIEGSRLGYWSTSNPKSKYDWYKIGGRWKGFLKLKVPKKSKWWFFGGRTVSTTDSALIDEIDVADLKTKEPAFVLINGQWCEGTMALSDTLNGKSDEMWKRKFQEIVDKIPSGSIVTVVDVHS